MRSREHTNFTYELEDLNFEHLKWWLSGVTGKPLEEIDGLCQELLDDEELRRHISDGLRSSPRRRLADPDVRYHKRIGWYVIVRATRPQHVVETGTDKGLGTVVLAAAVLRNGHGRVTTIDTNPDSGFLIRGKYAAVVDQVFGNSLDAIADLSVPVDFFLHDSLHTAEYELRELEAISRVATPSAYILSDYAHASPSLASWARSTGRAFSFFAESPKQHWLRGEGIGVAFDSKVPHA